jgi:transcriptional regulator with XRE-family HTH domain
MEAARQALAARMEELRDAAGMSQRQAALRGGMDPRNWARIEQGKLNPRLDSLLRIQFALDVDSLEALFGVATTAQILEE